MNINLVSSTFQTAVRLYNQAQHYMGLYTDRAMSDITRLTKVEPLVIVSKDCFGLDIMPDLQQTILNYVIADYSQAVNILTKVKDIQVIRVLDKLNPSRDATGMLLSTAVTNESMTPAALNFSLPTERKLAVTMEAKGSSPLEEAASLGVGKLVNIDIGFNNELGHEATAKIPVQFRLLPGFVNAAQMVSILGYGTDDTGVIARFQRAVDGGIAPFMDFIMAQDLIDEYRKAAIKDDSRTLQKIMSRVTTNKKFGLLTNNPSLATLSNIFVITEAERKSLESKFGGKITNKAMRDRMFQNVYASLIVVVDREWNTATFWDKGLDSAATLNFKDLKTSSQGKGPDLFEMMKSFNMGMPLSL